MLKSVKITDDELKFIAETRNEGCKEGAHTKISEGKPLPNGRSYSYCCNCLWAELEDCEDMKIGKVTTYPGTTLGGF